MTPLRGVTPPPVFSSSSSSSSLPSRLSFLLLLLSLSLLVSLPGLRVPFLSDDHVLLARVENLPPSAVPGLGGSFFRPLTALLVKAQLALAGFEPVPFHVVSALLAGLAAGGVAALARRLRPELAWFPPLAALVFLLTPAWGESRWWISCQGDLLTALWAVVSLTSFLAWLDRRGRDLLLWGAALAYLAALLSKEAALALPLAAALLAWGSGRWSRRAEAGTGALVAVLPLYLAARRYVLGGFLAGYGSDVHLSWRPGVALTSLLQLLWRSLLPAPGALGLSGWVVPAVAVAAGLLVAGVTVRRGQGRLVLALLAAAAVLLLPAANLGISWGDGGGTRFLTLPSVGTALALALAVEALVARGRLWRAVALLALAVLGFSASRGAAPWVAAGRRAEREVAAVAALSAGALRVVVLAPTDSVDGAYVLRNGLAEATSLPRILLLGRAVLGREAEGPVLRPLTEGWHELVFPDGGGFFSPLPLVPPPLLPDVQVRRIESRRVEVRVRPVPGLVVLAVVRSGVVPVPPSPDALHGRDARDTVPPAASGGRGGPAKEMRDHVRASGE